MFIFSASISLSHSNDTDDSSPPVGSVVIRDRKAPTRTSRVAQLSPVPSSSASPVRTRASNNEASNNEELVPVTPSRIALPASPARMLSAAVARFRPEIDGVVANVNRTAEQIGTEKDKALASTKRVRPLFLFASSLFCRFT